MGQHSMEPGNGITKKDVFNYYLFNYVIAINSYEIDW
jgi:hypothetical protein